MRNSAKATQYQQTKPANNSRRCGVTFRSINLPEMCRVFQTFRCHEKILAKLLVELSGKHRQLILLENISVQIHCQACISYFTRSKKCSSISEKSLLHFKNKFYKNIEADIHEIGRIFQEYTRG